MSKVTLRDCPPGLFKFGGAIGLKTEYRSMEPVGPVNVPGDLVRWRVGSHVEAYVVESGEVFWGGVTTAPERDALLVEPVTLDTLVLDALASHLRQPGEDLVRAVARAIALADSGTDIECMSENRGTHIAAMDCANAAIVTVVDEITKARAA